MTYAILRAEKLKTGGNIAGSLAHNYRTRETPNADAERTPLNRHSQPTAEAARAAIEARLPEKRRKNAVLCVEYFIGASPEYFAESDDRDGARYFATALEWLQERHGPENVVATSVHHDETSPHLIAYVVPLDEGGKLNARKFLGGTATLSAMQTDFARRVAHHGLERGIAGSKAKHQTVARYYATISEKAPKTASKTIFGNIRPDDYLKVENALEAFLAREKAMKHREQVLARKLREAEAEIAAVGEVRQELSDLRRRCYRAERDRDGYEQKLEALREEYRVMDKARMDAIDEARYWRDECEARDNGPALGS